MSARKRQSRLEKYCKAVISGRVVACKKIKAVCTMLLEDIKKTNGKWKFDQAAAERATEFIETFCCQPAGRLGTPLILEDYEAAWVQAIFGFVDSDGNRRFQDVLIVVGRKNGKTSLAAAISLYMLIADGEGAPQVVNAANSLDQAKLLFKAVMSMRKQSPKISKHTRKVEDGISCEFNIGILKPLASDSDNLDGLDVHLGVLDEIHAMQDGSIYDVIRQGMSARVQPLLLQITTNGFTRNGIFDSQYKYAEEWLEGKIKDDRFLAFVYELDSRDEWLVERNWYKANPGLGTVKSIEALRSNVLKAKNSPRYKATVMTKDFNMPENQSVAWLTYQEAVNTETFDLRSMGFRYGVVGFDASDTIDLTSAQMLLMRPGDDKIYEHSMYWIPEDVILGADNRADRKERDGVPYSAWIARGLMRTVPGNKIPKSVLLEWIDEVKREYDIWTFAVGYDPWHMDDNTVHELELYLGKDNVSPIIQGPRTLSNPMKQIQADYAANRIVDNHNPINEWCRMNVAIRSDVNDNIQPDKKGRNPKNRIDGWAAEIDAYITLMNKMGDYQQMI